jgi:hypothetical protein
MLPTAFLPRKNRGKLRGTDAFGRWGMDSGGELFWASDGVWGLNWRAVWVSLPVQSRSTGGLTPLRSPDGFSAATSSAEDRIGKKWLRLVGVVACRIQCPRQKFMNGSLRLPQMVSRQRLTITAAACDRRFNSGWIDVSMADWTHRMSCRRPSSPQPGICPDTKPNPTHPCLSGCTG